jgi:type III restriction enzyme
MLSHEPERLFLFRLIEHGRLLDSWVKAPDTEFYSVDYEYWRHGRDRVRRSFNPDFFIRLDIGHYLSRLPADAVLTGATRLRELQNEGIEQLVLVVEIKSDDDNTDETRAKEAYAKEHFAALNRRLRETQDVDVAQAFRDSVRQHYVFSLLRPRDYPGWFSRLKNGLVAA